MYATHDGTVTRLVDIEKSDDNDPAGSMVKISYKGPDGTSVETYYMHLSSIEEGISLGAEIKEGALIGRIGGSGFGKADKYPKIRVLYN